MLMAKILILAALNTSQSFASSPGVFVKITESCTLFSIEHFSSLVKPLTPAYRQALNLAWYRAGRLPFSPRGTGMGMSE
jgi:hypothetical protein